jgi:hypothetical protein
MRLSNIGWRHSDLASCKNLNLKYRGDRMLSLPIPQGRQSIRVLSKRRASLVVSQSRHSCLVLDFSQGGFRMRGSFHLRRGQMVELVLDEFPPICERCSVVWVGKAGSKYEGEVGLEIV